MDKADFMGSFEGELISIIASGHFDNAHNILFSVKVNISIYGYLCIYVWMFMYIFMGTYVSIY